MAKNIMKKLIALALTAGLCLPSGSTITVTAAPFASETARAAALEDQQMNRQLEIESDEQIPEDWIIKMDENTAPDITTEETPEPAGEKEAFTEHDGSDTEIWDDEEENLFTDEAAFTDGDEKTVPKNQNFSDIQESEITLQAENGADITGLLNALLWKVKDLASDEHPYKVVIPPGSYQITGTICMYSNIHLYAAGAIITKTSPQKHILLRLGNKAQSEGGFNGYRNITIEGGIWDSNYAVCQDKNEPGGFVGFRIGHATNVMIKNVTFLNNLKSHFLEIGGAKNVTVTGCRFKGYWKPYEEGGQECIQIDACRERIFPGYEPYDGTICENVVIDHNEFEDVFAGVGSHSMIFNHPYRSIRITNNFFKDIKKRAVWCLNYVDSVVSGNTMKNVGGGVYIRSIYSPHTYQGTGEVTKSGQNQYKENLLVENNQISTAESGNIGGALWRSFGIHVSGEIIKKAPQGIPDGTYIVRGLTIRKNTITGPGNGIWMSMANECAVSENTVNLTRSARILNKGICMGASSKNNVENNRIKGARGSGLYLYNGGSNINLASSRNTFIKNTFSSNGEDGILIDAGSHKTALKSNTCRNNQGSGMSLRSSNGIILEANSAENNRLYGIYGVYLQVQSQKQNTMTDNKEVYALYIKDSKGKLQCLANIREKTIVSEASSISGKAVGAKSIAAFLNKDQSQIGSGTVNSSGNYSFSVKKQKKGTTLLLKASDKYKNTVSKEVIVK